MSATAQLPLGHDESVGFACRAPFPAPELTQKWQAEFSTGLVVPIS